jgi:hypothetical protein
MDDMTGPRIYGTVRRKTAPTYHIFWRKIAPQAPQARRPTFRTYLARSQEAKTLQQEALARMTLTNGDRLSSDA